MTEREQFEAWAAGAGFALHKVTPCDGSEPRYDIGYAHDLWIGWQARAVLAQPVAAEPAYIAIDGAVFHEDGVSLIRRGYEDGYIARHPGAERVYRLAPTPA